MTGVPEDKFNDLTNLERAFAFPFLFWLFFSLCL